MSTVLWILHGAHLRMARRRWLKVSANFVPGQLSYFRLKLVFFSPLFLSIFDYYDYHSQSLMAGNFAALWPIDSKLLATKDLNLLKKHTKNQMASSILKVVFALSKSPHLHRELSNRPGMSVSHCTYAEIRTKYSEVLVLILTLSLHISRA